MLSTNFVEACIEIVIICIDLIKPNKKDYYGCITRVRLGYFGAYTPNLEQIILILEGSP